MKKNLTPLTNFQVKFYRVYLIPKNKIKVFSKFASQNFHKLLLICNKLKVFIKQQPLLHYTTINGRPTNFRILIFISRISLCVVTLTLQISYPNRSKNKKFRDIFAKRDKTSGQTFKPGLSGPNRGSTGIENMNNTVNGLIL